MVESLKVALSKFAKVALFSEGRIIPYKFYYSIQARTTFSIGILEDEQMVLRQKSLNRKRWGGE